jgi:hypothetical protein
VNHIYPKVSWVIPVINPKGDSFGGVTCINEIFCEETGNDRDAKSTINNRYRQAILIEKEL